MFFRIQEQSTPEQEHNQTQKNAKFHTKSLSSTETSRTWKIHQTQNMKNSSNPNQHEKTNQKNHQTSNPELHQTTPRSKKQQIIRHQQHRICRQQTQIHHQLTINSTESTWSKPSPSHGQLNSTKTTTDLHPNQT